MNTAAELVTEVTELVSFPDVAVQVNDLLADDVSDAEKVGAIIEQDPALTATLLKVANSSMYGVGGGVDSVAKAFTRIGAREIQELTLGICATRAFNGVPNEILSVEDFWQHSLLCGAAARILARRVRTPDAGMVFTGGLLHDIGHLVMFHLIPTESLEALALSRDEMDGDEVYLAEREVLGFDHMDVGRLLGELWNWPAALVQSIGRLPKRLTGQEARGIESFESLDEHRQAGLMLAGEQGIESVPIERSALQSGLAHEQSKDLLESVIG